MPSRGQANPRRGISESSRWGRAPTRGSRAWGPGWGPSASERKLAVSVTKTNTTVTFVLAGLFCPCVVSPVALAAPQVPFEQALADLASPDAATRLRTAKMLKDAAYFESAAPLAKLIVDPQDSVQLEAIAAELNIFIAEKIVPRKRVGFIVELRTPVAADAIFSTGPLAVGPRPVPGEVLDALRTAARDDNPRVRLEALYAFGVLAVQRGGDARRALLRASGPDLDSPRPFPRDRCVAFPCVSPPCSSPRRLVRNAWSRSARIAHSAPSVSRRRCNSAGSRSASRRCFPH